MADAYPKAVLFDLLTALLDSWSIWNAAAGSAERGRQWRGEYLKLTYGCGAYQPYEQLVRDSAAAVGLPAAAAASLTERWSQLPPWPGARELLQALRPHCKLAVVTNCSEHLGKQAASLLGVEWDAVVTSEEAGYYKPDPRPYLLALERLDVPPAEAAFVAGSGYDMFGTAAVGLRTFWHNRIGLTLPAGAAAPEREAADLQPALSWLRTFQTLPH
ncbi:HAD-IA family hydrolase [Bordetella genomosp. 12]|uniref:Haloacid dehalogenase n=1 Tax=Bordetella genomosp. 12 TaxID=463035 RepID=A0A261VB63_9BORD|nr:HAD-IA family hydrolase [Bordetella genomosp. 12]OZI71398.1 haloacid dehalogenase [Bordetella genomosp. 12]